MPAVNQIQLSPLTARTESRTYDAAHRIVTQAWSPLAPGSGLLGDAVIADIATSHGRTAAQVILRWFQHIDVVPVPKSGHPARIAENFDVFDFELTDDEVAAISALDLGEQHAVDSDSFGH